MRQYRVLYHGDDGGEGYLTYEFDAPGLSLQDVSYIGLGILFFHCWTPHNDSETIQFQNPEGEWHNLYSHPHWETCDKGVISYDEVRRNDDDETIDEEGNVKDE